MVRVVDFHRSEAVAVAVGAAEHVDLLHVVVDARRTERARFAHIRAQVALTRSRTENFGRFHRQVEDARASNAQNSFVQMHAGEPVAGRSQLVRHHRPRACPAIESFDARCNVRADMSAERVQRARIGCHEAEVASRRDHRACLYPLLLREFRQWIEYFDGIVDIIAILAAHDVDEAAQCCYLMVHSRIAHLVAGDRLELDGILQRRFVECQLTTIGFVEQRGTRFLR